MNQVYLTSVKYINNNNSYNKFSTNDQTNNGNSLNRKIFQANQNWKDKTFNSQKPNICNIPNTSEPYETKTQTRLVRERQKGWE